MNGRCMHVCLYRCSNPCVQISCIQKKKLTTHWHELPTLRGAGGTQARRHAAECTKRQKNRRPSQGRYIWKRPLAAANTSHSAICVGQQLGFRWWGWLYERTSFVPEELRDVHLPFSATWHHSCAAIREICKTSHVSLSSICFSYWLVLEATKSLGGWYERSIWNVKGQVWQSTLSFLL